MQGGEIFVLKMKPAKKVIDFAKEKKRLEDEKKNLEGYKVGIEKRLADKKFRENAPAPVVEQNEQSLAETEKKIAEIKKALESLT